MGIVDVLAKDGEARGGGAGLDREERAAAQRHQAVIRVRQDVNPITREELDAIADTWVDARFAWRTATCA